MWSTTRACASSGCARPGGSTANACFHQLTIRKDFVLRYDPSIFMKNLRCASVLVLVCLIQGVAAQPTRSPSVVSILRSELQRNMQVLSTQAVPAYFAAYRLHDTRT